MKAIYRIVLDTNVLVAGLRSRQGASFQLLSRLPLGEFQAIVSVPLVMEYTDVLHRPGMVPLTADAIDAVLNMVCKVAEAQKMHFLWRPQLRDPNDEMVLEAAVNGRADFIVTHNIKDFSVATRFAVRTITPAQCIQHLYGATP